MNTFLATVQELAGMHALGRNKQLDPLLVSVRITEHNLSQRSPTAWIMNQILQYKCTLRWTLHSVSWLLFIDLRGWLHTKIVYLSADGHPSKS